MKKIALFCMISMLFCSCEILKIIKEEPSALKQMDFALKGIRMTKKMEQTYYYDKKSPFVFDSNAIFIPCKINDTTHLVFYDFKSSGIGTTSGLLTEKIHGEAELPKCNKTIKLRTEKKTKNISNHQVMLKSGLKYYDVESDFFHFKNFVTVVTSQSNDTIAFEKNLSRFVINGIFDCVMRLSFSDTSIMLLDSISTYDTTGFTFVKSTFTCRGYTLCLTIDSIEYAFLFNTSDRGFIALPQYAEHQKCSFVDGNFKCDYFYVEYEKHKKENDSLITSEQNGLDTVIAQYANAITIGNVDFISGNILYTKRTVRPVVGMQFISQFDWIIDMHRQKIYAKKIKD